MIASQDKVLAFYCAGEEEEEVQAAMVLLIPLLPLTWLSSLSKKIICIQRKSIRTRAGRIQRARWIQMDTIRKYPDTGRPDTKSQLDTINFFSLQKHSGGSLVAERVQKGAQACLQQSELLPKI